jgi:two-component system chemotaxis response regulator CheB
MINAERVARDVIVIGGSAGAFPVMKGLLEVLPGSLPAAIGLVIHRSPYFESRLPSLLGSRSRLAVLEPRDGDPVRHGAVLLAPRDQHLVFEEDGVARLYRGPKEHLSRPAIDPLFRTAARSYGPRVAGVLLSGMNGDGVSGLIHIKARGGLSLVQSPAQAEYTVMPARAIEEDDVDAVVEVEALAGILTALAAGEAVAVPAPPTKDGARGRAPTRPAPGPGSPPGPGSRGARHGRRRP